MEQKIQFESTDGYILKKMRKLFCVFFLVLMGLISLSEQVEITLPVSEQLVSKLGLSIKKLTQVLRYFGTRQENKFAIWKRVQLTKKYLIQLNTQLAQFNNVIAGAANSVNGDTNIVIGNYNDIEGSNNWVFVSNFKGNINGDLLVADWRVEIDKSRQILISPRRAISFIDESRNQAMRKKFYGRRRSFCKWGNWAEPTGKRYEMWNTYTGYDDFTYEWNKQQQGHLRSESYSFSHTSNGGSSSISYSYRSGGSGGSTSHSHSYSSVSSGSGRSSSSSTSSLSSRVSSSSGGVFKF